MSNASAFWLRIDGHPATEIAAHTPPTWETEADGGCGAASWTFGLTVRSQHQALRKGALVEIMCGPMPVYTGLLNEPDRTTWECHASGLSASLRRIVALDTSGNSSRTLQYVLEQAQIDGSPVINPAPVTGTAAGDTANIVTIGQLFDDYAEQTGQRWGVDASRRVYMTPGPGAPTWLASPDAAAFGVTDEDVATRLFGTYSLVGGGKATARVGVQGLDATVDLTERGPITLAAAEAILSGLLLRRGDTSWVNGVTLHREQLTTMGGSPAFLASVTAGQILRAHGLASQVISQAPWLDVMIGKTRYTAGDDSIYLEPINTAPRTFVDVAAA